MKLPVFHPGALLFIGDAHALQADGEPTGTGVETSMDVEFTVALRKRAELSNPRLENAEYIVSIGAQPEFVSPLDHALKEAQRVIVTGVPRPQEGGEQVLLALVIELRESHQRQETVITVEAVEQRALLLAISGVPGGVHVDDDALHTPA